MSAPEEIPLIPEGQFILHWIREAGREQQVLFLSEGEVEGHAGYGLQIDRHRRLVVRHGATVTELGTFAGPRNGLKVQRVSEDPEHHSCFILNGNGFEDRILQGLQTRLRERCVREHGAWNIMVVPYDALQAAEIQLETIEPIEITADTNTRRTRTFRVPDPPDRLRHQEARNVRVNGREWRFEGTNWGGDWTGQHGGLGTWQYTVQVRWQPPNGQLAWYRVNRVNNPVNGSREGTLTYNEHRLGSSVFWADAPNGRHRYISAFDMQENPPMYFLAQLPDGPEVTDYETAITALAPPIVRNLPEDVQVFRHGDIFFVPTNLAYEYVVSQGKVHERRHTGRRILSRGGAGGGSRWTELPPSRRVNRRVTLLGTGHTADRVCKTEDGRTFCQGTVRHEPHLVAGDEERQPEHTDIVLTPGVWHLCVRNTVPSV